MTIEQEMETAVMQWLQGSNVKVTNQVRMEGVRFDVVAYDKLSRTFKVVECKPTYTDVDIGKAFGQICTYRDKIQHNPDEFVDAASRKDKITMRFQRWMEATNGAREINVQFYVVLTEKACSDVSRIRDFKTRYREFGIIRYKEDGTCRPYIKDGSNRNTELARAETQTIRLRLPWSAAATSEAK